MQPPLVRLNLEDFRTISRSKPQHKLIYVGDFEAMALNQFPYIVEAGHFTVIAHD